MINQIKDILTRQITAHWLQHLAFWIFLPVNDPAERLKTERQL